MLLCNALRHLAYTITLRASLLLQLRNFTLRFIEFIYLTLYPHQVPIKSTSQLIITGQLYPVPSPA